MGGIVWLASYPKSGNTWVRAFLHNLILKTEESYDINKINLLSAGDSAKEWYDEFLDKPSNECSIDEIAAARPKAQAKIASLTEGLIFVKTHNALVTHAGTPMITPEITAGAIYIIRNPLDIVVSLSHYLKVDIDSAIDIMNRSFETQSGNEKTIYQIWGSWSENVATWTKKLDPSLFVMRYEDLLADPMIPFAALMEFLYLRPTRRQLERAVENSSFERLQAQEREHGFVEMPSATGRFFRKGAVGQWKEVLTKNQVRTLLHAHYEQMARFGYMPEDPYTDSLSNM
jgi:hypothetical protein